MVPSKSRKPLTEEEVRHKLEGELKRPIPDPLWDYLCFCKYVEDYLLCPEPDTWASLLEHSHRLLRIGAGGDKAPRRSGEREVPPDKRLVALGHIWATEARREPEVIKFREEVLGGRLLTWEEAGPWIERQSREQPATCWIRTPLPDGYCPAKPRGFEWVGALVELPKEVAERWPISWGIEILTYIGRDEYVRKVRVARCGVLGRLKTLAERLTTLFPLWSEAWAVMFVLTDTVPLLSKAHIKFPLVLCGGAPLRITLEVDARMCPDEVARLYASYRNQVLRETGAPLKDKPLTEKHLCLSVYLAEHFETPWERLLKAWNAKYPEWAYSDMRTFARDAKAAWCRVTGRKWIPRPGGRKERERYAGR